MPRRAFKCTVNLKIHSVSCPGTWLPNKDECYLSVCLFGQHKRTALVNSIFPMHFLTGMKFERVLWTAIDPADVMERMESDQVFVELIQLDLPATGTILATYEENARDFLFPFPHLAPGLSQDRDALMEKTADFPCGISPRLQFTTKTTIVETDTPYTDAFESSLTGVDDVCTMSRSPRRSPRRSRPRTRSLSPPVPYFQELSLSDSDDPPTLQSEDELRPPFVIKKVDASLIGRLPGSPGPQKRKLKKKKKHSRNASASSRRSKSPTQKRITRVYCPHCLYPNSDKSCVVCQLYKKYTGQLYWGHCFHYHPSSHKHVPTKVICESAKFDADSRIFSGIDSDGSEYEIYIPPLSSTSPNSTYRRRLNYRPISPVRNSRIEQELLNDRVSEILRRKYPYTYNTYVPRTRRSLYDDLDELEYDTRRMRHKKY